MTTRSNSVPPPGACELKRQKLPNSKDMILSNFLKPKHRKIRPSIFRLLNTRSISIGNYQTSSYNMQRTVFDATYRSRNSRGFWSQDLIGHYCSVNAINMSPGEDMLISAGDDGRLLLWDIHNQLQADSNEDNLQAEELIDNYHQAFNSAVFTCTGNQVLGCGSQFSLIYDLETKKCLKELIVDYYMKDIDANPLCEALHATASDNGEVCIWDNRIDEQYSLLLTNSPDPYRGVQFNPIDPRYLATCHTVSGAQLFDVRVPKVPLITYKLDTLGRIKENVTNVTFNQNGTQLLVQTKEHNPIIFNTSTGQPLCRFFHSEMETNISKQKGCFLGVDDDYVALGSEDFRVYIWKLPKEISSQSIPTVNHGLLEVCHTPHLVLPGHRSIVSVLRYSRKHQMLCSAGVEKMIKLWSPWKLKGPNAQKQELNTYITRNKYSHWEYIHLMLQSHRFTPSLLPLHPPERTTAEDSVVIAFFDVLKEEFANTRTTFSGSSPNLFLGNPNSQDTTDTSWDSGIIFPGLLNYNHDSTDNSETDSESSSQHFNSLDGYDSSTPPEYEYTSLETIDEEFF